MAHQLKREKKVGRNQKCSCGSDKKYKNCCLKKQEEQSRQLKLAQEITNVKKEEEL